MRRFNDIFEAVTTYIEELLGVPVELGLSTNLPEMLDVLPTKVDAFLIYEGIERGIGLESSFAGIVHRFILYIRKTKLSLRGIDPLITRIIHLFENTTGYVFEIRDRTFTMFFDALSTGQVVQGEYLLTVTIEVIG